MFKLWQVILAFACLIGYDVVFVYASDVMMTVANGFDAPMKLLILNEAGYGMMGIGDIIVPGLLVSLCLRIDFVRSLLVKSLRTQGNSAEQLREDLLSDTDDVRYYFKGAMVGYFLGLFATIFYLMVTKEP